LSEECIKMTKLTKKKKIHIDDKVETKRTSES